MTRTYPVLILIAITALAAGFSRGVTQPSPTPTQNPSGIPSPITQPSHSPSPEPSQLPGIEFQSVAYYTTEAERVKIASASRKVQQVIQSQCFKDFMGARKLIQTNGKTPPQVADHIRGLRGQVAVKFYYARFSSAVAFRRPPSLEINMNRKFFGSWSTDCELASTFGHEGIGHSVGNFDHDYKWNTQRDFSVPYSINKAFEKCCV